MNHREIERMKMIINIDEMKAKRSQQQARRQLPDSQLTQFERELYAIERGA